MTLMAILIVAVPALLVALLFVGYIAFDARARLTQAETARTLLKSAELEPEGELIDFDFGGRRLPR